MFKVSVSGNSMSPTLLPNDTVIIMKDKTYVNGSILVFHYESNGYLIHRLLYASKGLYYCKGDNSFRIEVIKGEQIVGRVIFVKRGKTIFTPSQVNKDFIEMALRINREFVLSGYNYQKVLNSDIYSKYKKNYLKLK